MITMTTITMTMTSNHNDNDNNPHLNFFKGTVLGVKEQGLGIRDKGQGIRPKWSLTLKTKSCFLLKTEIHTKILNTEPILCDIRGLRGGIKNGVLKNWSESLS